MIYLFRFLNYFGGIAVAAGVLWFYTLFRRGGEMTGILLPSFDKPVAAAIVALIGFAMLFLAWVIQGIMRFKMRRLLAQQG